LGFARAGIARAERLDEDAARLDAWLADGRHGQMSYMADTAAVRPDPTHADMLPSARSVIALVMPYARAQALHGLEPGRIARYAQGRDYHGLLYDRTRAIKRRLREAGAHARSSVDTMPLLERAWAVRAGVGFIGKNACLIVPGIGSHVLLSLVVTSAELDTDEAMKGRCGECRLCLDGCPTDAFVAARSLDARRCISYLTIEHAGAIDETLQPQIGPWLFGCDVCQDVCPYNKTVPASPPARDPFAPHDRWSELGTEDFLQMNADVFDTYSRGSALRRAGRDGMARNAAIVLGNVGTKRHLPLLERTATADESPVVRATARSALLRLQARIDREG
ncbi:MAG TPA: tRNA epoxyqueuosine(34) reductase QueG, partial [Polyangiales bacterium]|nr:tRNA epoxyqueuosine(34) reductase QueG [Polyangiales bacterium]